MDPATAVAVIALAIVAGACCRVRLGRRRRDRLLPRRIAQDVESEILGGEDTSGGGLIVDTSTSPGTLEL